MALTKTDLSSIRQVIREETVSKKETVSRFDKLDKKFEKLFNFLDKDWSKLRRRMKTVEDELGINPSQDLL